MKFALVNPNWTFDGSIYFGCREPHLPLEFGYSKALLEQKGHEVLLVDAHLENLTLEEIKQRVGHFMPDFTVVTTAPSYLFWRCAPPELKMPQEVLGALRDVSDILVAVGPHASTTPRAALNKLNADLVVLGECEQVLPNLGICDPDEWHNLSSVCFKVYREFYVQGFPHAAELDKLPAIHWPRKLIQQHRHHHHRFDTDPEGPGAEMESSRGCPFRCSFCAKENFRSRYRERPLAIVLEELDGLIAHGVEYVYFIDEMFLANRPLLEALAERTVKFGIQTRIDQWDETALELLGRAGCVSIETGVESISAEGRQALSKESHLSTEDFIQRLVFAKRHIPFVQASLINAQMDDPQAVEVWRQQLHDHGVWANKPVPLFPYPGSPAYLNRWGLPDNMAWERALSHYTSTFSEFSDIQNPHPLPLSALEMDLTHV